jgi:hypothetical protein
MWYSALMAVGGIIGLMALWIAVQELARRQTPGAAPDSDMLEHYAHGCHSCISEGNCTFDPDDKECEASHHPTAPITGN